MPVKLWFNVLSRDIEAQMAFYRDLLGLPEIVGGRSAIHRAVEGPSFRLDFNAPAAYELLALQDRRPPETGIVPVTCFATFMLASAADVDLAGERAVALGGSVVKAPFVSHYGQRQIVIADPEHNIVRLAAYLQAPPRDHA